MRRRKRVHESKTGVSGVSARIRQDVIESGVLRDHERVVVGVSGGVDSVVLLDVLAGLNSPNLELHVAHLDHGLRPESAVEAEFVRNLAERYSLPFHTERIDVRALAASRCSGLEEAARKARYDFLLSVAARVGAGRIAVGHHADDQAETVLLHLLRGAGLNGLTGMSPLREDGVFRPFLSYERREIEEYARERGLTWVEDASNQSIDFRRNRIRHELLPLLERDYNPSIRAALLRLAEVARAADAYISGEAARKMQGRVRELSGGRFVVTVESLLDLPAALQREALRDLCRRTSGAGTTPSFERIEALRAALSRGTGGWMLEMGDGLEVFCGSGEVQFSPPGPDVHYPQRQAVPLPLSGTVRAHGFDLVVNCEVRPWHGNTDELKGMPRLVTCVDLDRMGGYPVLRDWSEGETFVPIGRTSPVKVAEFLAKEGVPAPRRRRVPVVADERQVLWVVGFRPAEPVRLSDTTRRVLIVSVAAE